MAAPIPRDEPVTMATLFLRDKVECSDEAITGDLNLARGFCYYSLR